MMMKVGVLGCGAIGLASAAWMGHRGHDVRLWAPRGPYPHPLQTQTLHCTGVLESVQSVGVAQTVEELVGWADTLLIAVPVNAHRSVMNAMVPHLRSGHTVIVSSMSSLSSLYLYEAALNRGVSITVASFGTTVLTGRRQSATQVRIMTRRTSLGVSGLPRTRTSEAVALCERLFGEGFTEQDNALATALTNINPVAHGPLALFNWTRIERAEEWPQYHYMSPRVAAVIEEMDRERLAIANAFGLTVRSIERHFEQSFNTESNRLEDIAAELHRKRGGPPGPTDVQTRFLAEDVPYGLVFTEVLGHIAQVPTPATHACATMAGLVVGEDFAAANDLIYPLRLPSESLDGLIARVNADR